jgi:hypothetical protein
MAKLASIHGSKHWTMNPCMSSFRHVTTPGAYCRAAFSPRVRGHARLEKCSNGGSLRWLGAANATRFVYVTRPCPTSVYRRSSELTVGARVSKAEPLLGIAEMAGTRQRRKAGAFAADAPAANVKISRLLGRLLVRYLSGPAGLPQVAPLPSAPTQPRKTQGARHGPG